MLILTRKLGERITIGDDIVITLLDIKGMHVRVGIEAPKHVEIHRQEIYDRIREGNLKSSEIDDADLVEAASLVQSISTKREDN